MKTHWASTVGRAVAFAKAGRAARKMRRADTPEARLLARTHLAQVLGESRGVVMKIGQLAATDAEADPLRSLLTGVPALLLSEIGPEIEKALGHPIVSSFTTFEESKAAASLGQVHRATLPGGAPVAVKARYPGVAQAVRAELTLAGLMPGLGPVRKWGFDLAGYKRMLLENMTRELDYRDEARRQTMFAERVRVEGLVTPHVLPTLCRETLLVQSWEDGVRLSAARSWPKQDRLELGRVLLETLFVSVFHAGLVHGDPHAGNYLVRASSGPRRAELVLLDYGCTIDVPQAARLALLQLIIGLRDGGEVDPFSAFVAMGFAPDKLEPLRGALHELCAALFRPFLGEGAFRVKDWAIGSAVEAACGELKWWFRAAGPPDLLLLLRAFQGVCQHLETLDVALPWWPLVERAVGPRLLKEARNYPLARCHGNDATLPEPRARLLKVRVVEAGLERASLVLPGREALRLEQIMPSEIAQRIKAKGIDLGLIQRDLLRRNLAPGEVFKDEQGSSEWRVWLE